MIQLPQTWTMPRYLMRNYEARKDIHVVNKWCLLKIGGSGERIGFFQAKRALKGMAKDSSFSSTNTAVRGYSLWLGCLCCCHCHRVVCCSRLSLSSAVCLCHSPLLNCLRWMTDPGSEGHSGMCLRTHPPDLRVCCLMWEIKVTAPYCCSIKCNDFHLLYN